MQMFTVLIIRVAGVSPYLDLRDLGRNPVHPLVAGAHFTR